MRLAKSKVEVHFYKLLVEQIIGLDHIRFHDFIYKLLVEQIITNTPNSPFIRFYKLLVEQIILNLVGRS